MLRAESLVPTRSHVGGAFYHLYVEHRVRWTDFHVSFESTTVNGLPDSPKTEAKGALLVRGPWDETLGSPGLPFDVNRSQSFPGP